MDRVRQALFNILEHHPWSPEIADLFDGSEVLDAFCGTGALAFEALSRGSSKATLFDKDREALAVATKNAAKLGLTKACHILMTDTLSPPRAKKPSKLVFLAPPYRKDLIPASMLSLKEAGWISKGTLLVAETAKKETLMAPDGFEILFARFYGDTGLHFIEC